MNPHFSDLQIAVAILAFLAGVAFTLVAFSIFLKSEIKEGPRPMNRKMKEFFNQ